MKWVRHYDSDERETIRQALKVLDRKIAEHATISSDGIVADCERILSDPHDIRIHLPFTDAQLRVARWALGQVIWSEKP